MLTKRKLKISERIDIWFHYFNEEFIISFILSENYYFQEFNQFLLNWFFDSSHFNSIFDLMINTHQLFLMISINCNLISYSMVFVFHNYIHCINKYKIFVNNQKKYMKFNSNSFQFWFKEKLNKFKNKQFQSMYIINKYITIPSNVTSIGFIFICERKMYINSTDK